MKDEVAPFFDWIRKAPALPLAVSVVAGLLLVAANSVSDWFALREYRPWISVVFFVSIALALAHALIALGAWSSRLHKDWSAGRAVRHRLRDLTKGEKSILKLYVDRKARVIDLDERYGSYNRNLWTGGS
jgi:hypothetical protein